MLKPVGSTESINRENNFYNQIMKVDDTNDFRKAISKEVNTHIERKHWEMIQREQLPKGEKIIPKVWDFKWKRHMKRKSLYKHKARLNVHEVKQ